MFCSEKVMAFAPGSSKSIWNFDPRSIPGCQTWLDASDSNTITYSSGSNVSIWKDKAPYGNNARRLQGTPIRVSNAMNGLPAMYLDGSNATSAAFTGTCPPNVTNQLTVFAVFTVESGVQDSGRLFSLMYPDYQNPNSMVPLGYNTGANTLRVERNSSGYNATSNALTFGTPTLAACVVNGATTTIHMNGTQILSTSTVASNLAYTYYTIGCFGQARGVGDNGVGPWNGYNWKGYVGEIILYSNALSTAQRQQVEGYLAWKWLGGIPAILQFTQLTGAGSKIWQQPSFSSNMQTGIAVQNGSGYIWTTTDGGVSWTQRLGPYYWFSAAISADGSTMYAGQYVNPGTPGYLYKSTDGGANWTWLSNAPGTAQVGIACSSNGTIVYTVNTSVASVSTNGGSTWTSNASPGSSFCICCSLNGSIAYAATPYVYVTSNTGATWTTITSGIPAANYFGSACSADGTKAAVTGNSNVYVSSNTGTSWSTAAAVSGLIQIRTYGLAMSSNGNTMYVFGGTSLYKTINFGVSWAVQSGLTTASGMYSDGGGIACSRDGSNVIVATNNSSTAGYLYKGTPGSSHPFYPTKPFLRTFRPIDIDGCALWLDANDATTFTLSGSNITSWNDKSGNGNNATATGTPTYNTAGLNSRPATAFNGSCYFQGNVSITGQTLTCFAVGSFVNSGGSDQRFVSLAATGQADWNSASRVAAIFNQGSTTSIASYRNTPATFPRHSGSYGTPFIACTVYDGTNGYIYVNGLPGNVQASYASAGTFAISKYCIGEQVLVTGEIIRNGGFVSEVLTYTTALTTAQRQQVEGYLANKWKITIPTVGVSSTTPSLTNCKLWLDGADILGTGAPAPATITTWADKSGTSNTVTANSLSVGQAIASSPMGPFINGACYFSITGGLVGSIVNVPFVIFIVETLALSAGTPFFFGNDTVPNPTTNNTLHMGYRNSGNFTFAFFGNDIEVYQAFSNAVTRVWAFYMPSSGNRNVRLNGSIVGTGNTTRLGNFNAPVIGRVFGGYGDAYYGTISEILVYNADIGVPAIQTVESYLMAKWQPGTLVPKFTIPAGIALPFSPLQISGSCLWLDANDPAGTGTQPSAGALATWTDKSGSNNHMTAAGTTPTFSNVPPGAVTFGGAGYYSKASAVFSNFYTAFFVYKQTGATGPLYTTGASSGSNGLFPNEAGTTYFTRGDSTWYTVSSPFTSNVTNLAGVSFSSNAVGSNQSLFYNGSNVVTTTQANTITYTNLLIGSRQSGGTQYFTGSIYEVLAYGGTLTTNERQRVEGYLAQKWKV